MPTASGERSSVPGSTCAGTSGERARGRAYHLCRPTTCGGRSGRGSANKALILRSLHRPWATRTRAWSSGCTGICPQRTFAARSRRRYRFTRAFCRFARETKGPAAPRGLSPVYQMGAKSMLRMDSADSRVPNFLRDLCAETESNRRHGDFQSPALPTELSARTTTVRLPRGEPEGWPEGRGDSRKGRRGVKRGWRPRRGGPPRNRNRPRPYSSYGARRALPRRWRRRILAPSLVPARIIAGHLEIRLFSPPPCRLPSIGTHLGYWRLWRHPQAHRAHHRGQIRGRERRRRRGVRDGLPGDAPDLEAAGGAEGVQGADGLLRPGPAEAPRRVHSRGRAPRRPLGAHGRHRAGSRHRDARGRG